MRINRWLKWTLVIVVVCFIVEGALRLTLQELEAMHFLRWSAPLPTPLAEVQKHNEDLAKRAVAENIIHMFMFDPGTVPEAWRGKNNWWFVTDEDGTIRPIPGPAGNMPPPDVWTGLCNQQWYDYLKKRGTTFAEVASKAAALRANLTTTQRLIARNPKGMVRLGLARIEDMIPVPSKKEVWFDDEAKKAWEAYREARARFAALQLLLYQ